ncbi:uncharacterized protein MYCFIDRAFT_172709 [Pseudocercospora fijiensis CIRAD86]|uniref:Uncharacterized protein n=1 Tax=Pseudocercospora fijiensis (strain CIRAD86) TaxID=383855 RepID=M2ZB04_PSEFD|nr:uncharacterized protein MYCFIDRAFT_172709 [Pseudocercospora fijiensis CIRAD86]EME87030.1 hypothetical protein MYCFIDRAFT_172709 [Pseudocercospora fijiensis CIRAD86]
MPVKAMSFKAEGSTTIYKFSSEDEVYVEAVTCNVHGAEEETRLESCRSRGSILRGTDGFDGAILLVPGKLRRCLVGVQDSSHAARRRGVVVRCAGTMGTKDVSVTHEAAGFGDLHKKDICLAGRKAICLSRSQWPPAEYVDGHDGIGGAADHRPSRDRYHHAGRAVSVVVAHHGLENMCIHVSYCEVMDVRLAWKEFPPHPGHCIFKALVIAGRIVNGRRLHRNASCLDARSAACIRSRKSWVGGVEVCVLFRQFKVVTLKATNFAQSGNKSCEMLLVSHRYQPVVNNVAQDQKGGPDDYWNKDGRQDSAKQWPSRCGPQCRRHRPLLSPTLLIGGKVCTSASISSLEDRRRCCSAGDLAVSFDMGCVCRVSLVRPFHAQPIDDQNVTVDCEFGRNAELGRLERRHSHLRKHRVFELTEFGLKDGLNIKFG